MTPDDSEPRRLQTIPDDYGWLRTASDDSRRLRRTLDDTGWLRLQTTPNDSRRIQTTPDESRRLWMTPNGFRYNAGRTYLPESVPMSPKSDRSWLRIFANFTHSPSTTPPRDSSQNHEFDGMTHPQRFVLCAENFSPAFDCVTSSEGGSLYNTPLCRGEMGGCGSLRLSASRASFVWAKKKNNTSLK